MGSIQGIDAGFLGRRRMDAFFERLGVRAATIDELLSDEFETLPGQKAHCDLAAHRLSAWCQSCASGDWSMFNRRLERDGLSLAHVLGRFATVRRKASATLPAWIEDAIWIEEALQGPGSAGPEETGDRAYPFECLFRPVVRKAKALLWATALPRSTSASPRRGKPRLLRPIQQTMRRRASTPEHWSTTGSPQKCEWAGSGVFLKTSRCSCERLRPLRANGSIRHASLSRAWTPIGRQSSATFFPGRPSEKSTRSKATCPIFTMTVVRCRSYGSTMA